ncbi:MAG: extracellular solute-binding protein [Oscillospiraceae bacterium]|nr:extracellular solute-binding protein [Oscillospiraceae bacterium]
MKSIMKPAALMLALILVLSLLGACGSQTAPSVSDAASVQASDVSAAENAESPAAEEPAAEASAAELPAEASEVEEVPELELGEVTYPLDAEGATLTYWLPWMPALSMLYTTYLDHPAYAAAEEATGVSVDYISCSQESAATEFNLMVASGTTYDILSGAAGYYNGGVAAGINDDVLLDLTDLLPEYVPDYYREFVTNPNWVKFATTDDGTIGAIYCFNAVELGLSSGNFIRQDWLDELGLEAPVTIDDYHDVLTAFKENYHISDPYVMNANLTSPLSYAFGTASFDVDNASSLAFFLEDRKVQSVFTSPKYRDYIGTLAAWFQEGLIGSDFFNRASDPMNSANTSIILGGQAGIWNTVMNNLVDYPKQATDPGFACAALPDALPSDGSLLTFYSSDPGSAGNASIGASSENWELALKWINFWSTEEGLLLARYGVEGVSYTMENGEPVYTDVIYNNPDGFIFQLARIMYCAASVPTFGDPRIVRDNVYSDEVIACTAVWESAYGSSDSYISSSVTMTTDESERFYGMYTDIGTYAQTELMRFVVGENSMDNWDEFVSHVESMGIEDCTAIYQDAYDRYEAR